MEASDEDVSTDSTKKGMTYVPHSHGTRGARLVWGGLARARPLPVGIVEREMHCRVTAEQRKCTDTGCCVLLLLCLALWAGVAAFVIPRADWRRIVYGSDSLGRTCGQGMWGNKTRLFFPDVKGDLLALQSLAANGTSLSSSSSTIGTEGVDIYNDLTSICVETCPMAGDVVCMDGFLEDSSLTHPPNASEVEQCYGVNGIGTARASVCSSCWLSLFNTSDVFFHCISQPPVATSSLRRCTFPNNPENVSDPTHLEPDDDECLVISEVVTALSQSASLDVDPVSKMLSDAVSGLSGWCLDIINSYAVVLGIAPLLSGLVSFLCIISIGRSCKVCRKIDEVVLVGTVYCGGSAFFVWTMLGFGLLFALMVTALAWLHTGLFSLDIAADFLDNSSTALEATVAAALGGFSVNVSDPNFGLFAGSLGELTGVQVLLSENVVAWRIIAFVSLLVCIIAAGALCAFQKKIKLVSTSDLRTVLGLLTSFLVHGNPPSPDQTQTKPPFALW